MNETQTARQIATTARNEAQAAGLSRDEAARVYVAALRTAVAEGFSTAGIGR